jgi:hypothetical protein
VSVLLIVISVIVFEWGILNKKAQVLGWLSSIMSAVFVWGFSVYYILGNAKMFLLTIPCSIIMFSIVAGIIESLLLLSGGSIMLFGVIDLCSFGDLSFCLKHKVVMLVGYYLFGGGFLLYIKKHRLYLAKAASKSYFLSQSTTETKNFQSTICSLKNNEQALTEKIKNNEFFLTPC